MIKYYYYVDEREHTLNLIGTAAIVRGDSRSSSVVLVFPSEFDIDVTAAVLRMYFVAPGERSEAYSTLGTVTANADGSHSVEWPLTSAYTGNGGILSFSLTIIASVDSETVQWNSRKVRLKVFDSHYTPDSEEDEETYASRLVVLEAAMAAAESAIAGKQNTLTFDDAPTEGSTNPVTSGGVAAAYGTGTTGETYSTIYDSTVTTAADDTHLSPYAAINLDYTLHKKKGYRVTFDGTTYTLPPEKWWSIMSNDAVSAYTYLGNIALYVEDTSGIPQGVRSDLQFFIWESGHTDEGTDLSICTAEAGEHTLVIEEITYTYEMLPTRLTQGVEFPFIKVIPNGELSAYDCLDIGVNAIKSKRATVAIGIGNTVSEDFSRAFGTHNVSSGTNAFAIGGDNTASTHYAYAIGYGNTASGTAAFAIGSGNTASHYTATAVGYQNTASGNTATAIGYRNTASGSYAAAFGYETTASGGSSHAEGQYAVTSGNMSHAEGDSTRAMAKCSHTEGISTIADASQVGTHIGGVNNLVSTETGKTVTYYRRDADGNIIGSERTVTLGKYAEIIGNGDSDTDRSNARTLDYEGNEAIAGNMTVGGDTLTIGGVSITAAQLTALLALL